MYISNNKFYGKSFINSSLINSEKPSFVGNSKQNDELKHSNYPSLYAMSNSWKLSFGTIFTTKIVKGMDVCNYTEFFRRDTNWDLLADYLINKCNKIECETNKKQNVIFHGCSDGSGAYSLAIKLIDRLGFEKANELFFPIIAKDIDESAIKEAKKGVIGLERFNFSQVHEKDIIAIKKNIKNTKFEDFFIKADQTKFPPEGTEQDTFIKYQVSDMLKKAVKFECRDVTKDTKQKFPPNSILMLTNFWAYIKPELQKTLVKDLYENLPAGSTVICGRFEQVKTMACEMLNKQGFKVVKKRIILPVWNNNSYNGTRYIGECERKEEKDIPKFGVFEKV